MEKEFTITKEQILKLADESSFTKATLNQMFPEAFKTELEVGKWYKWHEGILFITKIDNDCAWFYGVDEYGNWRAKDWYSKSSEVRPQLATDKEVETALINEAKKRGFKEGVRFKRINSITCECENGVDTIKRKLKFDGVGLITSIDYIFFKGIWAEIISEPIELTLEQIAEKFNVNVEQLKIKK